eukprot:4256478-Alexandrium_andersonii.AAC.1
MRWHRSGSPDDDIACRHRGVAPDWRYRLLTVAVHNCDAFLKARQPWSSIGRPLPERSVVTSPHNQ